MKDKIQDLKVGKVLYSLSYNLSISEEIITRVTPKCFYVSSYRRGMDDISLYGDSVQSRVDRETAKMTSCSYFGTYKEALEAKKRELEKKRSIAESQVNYYSNMIKEVNHVIKQL